MLDMLKKAMFTGIGLALKTREEVEDAAKEWADRQRMSEEEGRKFMEELLGKYDASRGRLEERIEKTVADILKKTNIATREEMDALKAEVALLRKAVNLDAGALEKRTDD